MREIGFQQQHLVPVASSMGVNHDNSYQTKLCDTEIVGIFVTGVITLTPLLIWTLSPLSPVEEWWLLRLSVAVQYTKSYFSCPKVEEENSSLAIIHLTPHFMIYPFKAE